MHIEGHPVGQAPTVAGSGDCAGLEQSQVATVAVQVLALPRGEVHAGLAWALVDGEDGLTHPPGSLAGGLAQPQRLHSQRHIMLPLVLAETWVGYMGIRDASSVSQPEDKQQPQETWVPRL